MWHCFEFFTCFSFVLDLWSKFRLPTVWRLLWRLCYFRTWMLGRLDLWFWQLEVVTFAMVHQRICNGDILKSGLYFILHQKHWIVGFSFASASLTFQRWSQYWIFRLIMTWVSNASDKIKIANPDGQIIEEIQLSNHLRKFTLGFELWKVLIRFSFRSCLSFHFTRHSFYVFC